MKFKLKQLSQLGLLSILWTVVPLIIVEVLMTVFDPYLFKGFYQYDSDLGFRVRSGVLGANRWGFSDREYPLKKLPSHYRILVVGDSFGWEGGLDGNYTAIVENLFERHLGQPKVEVINASIPMADPQVYLGLLKKYGLQFNPDLVVLGFFVGNDLHTPPHIKRIVVNDIYLDIDKRKEIKILGYPIIPQSRFLLFVQQKYKIFQEQLKAKPQLNQEQQGFFAEETYLNIERQRMEICNPHLLAQGVTRPQIDFALQQVGEMSNILKQRNIPFVVAIIPDEYQVNPQLADRIFQKFNLDPQNYELDLPQKLLKQNFDSANIAYIDFLPVFKEKSQRKSFYKLRDSHWNEAGNNLAAKLLFEKLVKKVEPQLD